MYVLTDGGNTVVEFPYSSGQLRKANPNVSFPKEITDQMLAEYNIFPVEVEALPVIDEATQVVERASTPTFVTDRWVLGSMTRAKTQTEIDEDLVNRRASMKVTPRQARLALNQQGLLATAESTIAAMNEPDRTVVQLEWEYASVFDRNYTWVQSMGTQMGLTDTDLDNLFDLAKTL